jgi:small-conductance mechanosensitive channel
MELLGLNADQWVDLGISIGAVLVTAVVGRWLIRVLLDRGLMSLTRRTQSSLDETVLNILRPPLYWLLLVLVLRISLERLDFVPVSWQGYYADVFFVLYLVLAVVVLYRAADGLTDWYAQVMADQAGERLERQWMPFIRRVAWILIGLIGIITLLSHFEVDVTGLITTLGIGSLAVALAAQASLADMINGFMIMIDQPYRVGDRIEILDLNTWGDVVDIGLRSTRVRTRDNRMVIVPNSVIGKSLVVNYSYPDTEYRIQIHVGVAYGTDIDRARGIMIDAVRGVPGVLEDKRVEALFLEFGDSAMIFRVRWWLDSYYDARRMFDRVNSALLEALEREGIELPAPIRTLYHQVDEANAKRIADAFSRSGERAGRAGEG